jgi:hypothetical protein
VSGDGPRKTTTQFLADLGIVDAVEEHGDTVANNLGVRIHACSGELNLWRFDMPQHIISTISINAGSIAKSAAYPLITNVVNRLTARMPSVPQGEIRMLPTLPPGAKFCPLCGHPLAP